MPRIIRLTFTTCPAGEEGQFEEWYRGAHIPELIAAGIYQSGQLFALSGAGPAMQTADGPLVARYVAVYELDTENAATIEERLERARPRMTPLYPGMTILSRAVYTSLSELQQGSRSGAVADQAQR